MHKLYYAPGACSLAPHIILREAGLPFTLVRVDFARGRRTEDGGNLVNINPKGYVPALVLPDSQVVTEAAVVMQYIADLRPESGLAPPPTSFERVRLQEWLNYIATELHKALAPFFMGEANDEYKDATKVRLLARLAYMGRCLGDRSFLLGERFTVADAYAFYALRTWQRLVKGEFVDTLAAYQTRIALRPAVTAALEAEGLGVL